MNVERIQNHFHFLFKISFFMMASMNIYRIKITFTFFYFKSLSLFLLWLLWLLKEFKITFTFFKSLKFNRWLCLLWILKEITLIFLYWKSRSPFYSISRSLYFTMAFINIERIENHFSNLISQLFIRCTETLRCRR